MIEAFEDFVGKDWRKLLTCMGGMLLFSLGVNLFIVPAGLYNGGMLGISQIIRTILTRYAGFDFGGRDVAGMINMALNVPLFFLAFRYISKGFFVRTLVCVISQTFFLTLIPVPAEAIVDDMLTASVMGGIIAGCGSGLALRSGGSSGGLDILGMYCTKKFQGFSVGRLCLSVNICIYMTCAILFDIKVVIYCVIYTVFSTLILDKTHIQNICTEVFIITKEEPQKVMEYILKDLERGATYWEAKGGYTGEQTHIIFTVVSKYELVALKRRLKIVDPHAFLVDKEEVDIDGRFVKHL